MMRMQAIRRMNNIEWKPDLGTFFPPGFSPSMTRRERLAATLTEALELMKEWDEEDDDDFDSDKKEECGPKKAE
jgi:hypothetical protein